MTFQTVVVPVVSLLVLVLPGLVVGLLAALRPGVALATAPLITYGITTAAATAASFVPFHWNALTLMIVTALVALAILLVRVLTGRGSGWRRSVRVERPARLSWRDWVVVGGVVSGGSLSAGVLLSGFGRLAAPNQDWDYVFHANAVRFLTDSGDLAPTALRVINDWESVDFYYPHTLHALAATVAQLTGATPFEALNAQAMLVCLIAGAGLAMLLRRLGAPLAVTASTPLLLAGFASFPYDLLWRGPLLPYAAGVAVSPAFVIILDVVLQRRSPALVVLAGLGAAGLLGLHPSTALSAGLVVLVYLGFRWAAPTRTPGRDVLLLVAAGALAVVAAFPAAKGAVLKTTGGWVQDWPAIERPGQAVGDLFLLNHGSATPQYWLAGLMIVGALTLYRARYLWWWVGSSVIAVALFVLAASSDSKFVTDLTAPWWNDRYRFAALAVLGFAPLAAHGLLSLATLAATAVRRVLGGRAYRLSSRAVTGAMVAAGLVVLALISQGLYAPSNQARIAGAYQDDRTLDHHEVAAMEWLAEHSSGGAVMNDSNDGSAYLSAVAGLRPVFGHIVNPGAVWLLGDTQQLLFERFNCLDSDPAVRQAIEELDIRYVFLGSGFVRQDFHRAPGLVGVGRAASLQLVHQTTGVRIYEVDLTETPVEPVPACDRSESDGDMTG
ncbi:DUF6541 family protein [Blastococcus mobilis]|uniref:Uncharacterized protein n=1 Tax=Blastococcus mobilis TaxID=1938746 RepID=A0A238XE29_9ACTN|nr:DUF6541 family protein [Blastococcus mobilis]SNR56922.1 hypothetical protein SAMN06272737_11312 [Blastococcus mobilis]